MSEICKKYNLTPEQYKNMVQDGVISTTFPHYDEIYASFQKNLSNSTGREDAILKTCIENNCSRSTVYTVITTMLNKFS